MPIYKKIVSDCPHAINSKIETEFLNIHANTEIRKTHLFDGRYENIYMNEQHIPELKVLIDEARIHAQKILGITHIRAGYWFNYMPPGSTTTLHTHDDDDELLSAVYYIDVPKDSGNLIIYDDSKSGLAKQIEIQPKAGEFIFFKPNVRHEVTKNNSRRHRLSIGINFGPNN